MSDKYWAKVQREIARLSELRWARIAANARKDREMSERMRAMAKARARKSKKRRAS